MIRLALSSLRTRRTAVLAIFLTTLVGGSMTIAFGSMLDVGEGAAATESDQTVLQLMATVVGGWGAIIVASAVVTTTAILARQRAAELGLLRSAGATPAQVTRMVFVEIGLVSLIGVVCAIPFGVGLGVLLLHLLKESGQVSEGLGFRVGFGALGFGAENTVLIAWVATWLSARRISRRTVQDLLGAAGGRPVRMGRTRRLVGLVLVAAGLSCAALTATVLDPDELATQSVAGEAAILPAIGLAILLPALLPTLVTLASPLVRALGGPVAHLGVIDLKALASRRATSAMPVVVYTAIASAVFYIQMTWNHVHPVATEDDKNAATLNYVVVGMLAVFAAVMVVNLLVTEVTNRRREFAQLELNGATPRQVYRVVAVQTFLTTLAGVAVGSFAAALAVVPYSLAVTDDPVPPTPPWTYLVVVSLAFVLAFAASLTAAGRALRRPAIQAMRLGVET